MSDQDRPDSPFVEDDDTFGGFFAPLENTKPYLKVGFEGFAATGKTFTMVQLAIGLHKRIGSTKPIVYFDTEKAGKFLKPFFAEAGVRVLHKESKSMADLKQTMQLIREQKVSDILLVDSISHLWEDFVESYKKRVKKTRLEFQDWGIIKPTWKAEFSDPYVQDPYHSFFTGRAGFEYDNEVNPETNKREIFRSGIKMKVEGETAYEPDILVLMERFEEVLGDDKRVWRSATIIKDRSTLIDGKTFRDPKVEDFMPAIERCLAEPVKRAVSQLGDTGSLFASEEDKRAWLKRRDIALEEIEGLLLNRWQSQGGSDKAARQEAMFTVFNTRSWTAISSKRPEDLEAGKLKLEAYIAELAKKFEAEAAAAIEAKKAEEEKEAEALKMKQAEKAAKEAAKVAKKSGKEAKGGDSEPAAA